MDRSEARLTGASLRTLATCVAASMTLMSAAQAEVAVGLNAGISRSDNIKRVDTDETDETVGSVNVNFDVAEKSARSRANVVGDLSYLNYFQGTFDDEVIGRIAGEGVLTLLPDRLDLLASDTFGQEAVQSFAAVTPDNRENVNVFTVGPRLTLDAGSQNQLQLSGRYSLLSYEKSTLDGDRTGGDLALIRRLSSSSTVSLNGDYEDVNYDDDRNNTDFHRSEEFLRYTATGGRTKLSIDAGVNQTGGASDDESGFLGRVQLSRRVSPYTNVTAALAREISDAGNNFEQLQKLSTDGVGTQSVQNISGPFTSRSASLGLGYDRARLGFSISGSLFDEDFSSQSSADRTRSVIAVSARRDLTPVVRLSFTAQRMHEDYDVAVQNFTEVYTTLALSWRLGASLTTLAQIEHFDRNGRVGGGGDYVENRISLRAGYSFGGKSQTTNEIPVQTGMFR